MRAREFYLISAQNNLGRGAPRVWDVQSQQGAGRARADGLHRCGQVKSVGRVSRECGRVEAVPADGCFVPHAESLFRSLTNTSFRLSARELFFHRHVRHARGDGACPQIGSSKNGRRDGPPALLQCSDLGAQSAAAGGLQDAGKAAAH